MLAWTIHSDGAFPLVGIKPSRDCVFIFAIVKWRHVVKLFFGDMANGTVLANSNTHSSPQQGSLIGVLCDSNVCAYGRWTRM